MTNFFSGYDAWKLDSGREDDGGSECDCCGEDKKGCIDTTTGGRFPIDVHVCPSCRGEDQDPDDERDRRQDERED
jgi:hypothetical protein